MNRPNKTKLFSEVVALSAWRTEFDGQTGIADLFADVVFGTGYLGAEKSSPVRFKLSLSRAEIRLIVPEVEPATLLKASIASLDQTSKTRKTVIESQGEATADVGASIASGVAANASAKGKVTETRREEYEEVVFQMSVSDRPSEDGHIWEVSSSSVLKHRPWSRGERRAQIRRDNVEDMRLPPTARFLVRCRREDLQFSEIAFKGEELTFWDKLIRSKQVAVESYLRDEMAKVGLEFENFDDPYGVLILAEDLVDE